MISCALPLDFSQEYISFPVGYYHMDANCADSSLAPQKHQGWGLLYTVFGQVTFKVNDESIVTQSGDVLLITENALQECRLLDSAAAFECLVFQPNCITNFLMSPGHLSKVPRVYFDCREFPELSEIVSRAMNAFRNHQEKQVDEMHIASRELIVRGCLSQFMGIVIRDGLYEHNAQPDNSGYTAQIQAVLDYIGGHYDTPITLETLARIAGLSSQYFCEIFRQFMNRTPMDYVLAYRIEQARMLLLTTDASITDISLRCGFNDSGYFARRFKMWFGVTPSQYRKQFRNA